MRNHRPLRSFIPSVFAFLKTIPRGRVVTYQSVADRCGLSNARHVGWILRQNTDPDRIPCYRVVRSTGRLAMGYAFGGPRGQRERLVADGIVFDVSGRIRNLQRRVGTGTP